MPTSSETLPNEHLSGTELAEIIMGDFERMVKRDGMLNDTQGYGRVGYKVTLQLILDDPFYPKHQVSTESQSNKAKPVIVNPKEAELKATDKVKKIGKVIERHINNPNVERIKNGMPIKVQSMDRSTGKIKERNIKYTPEEAGIEGGVDAGSKKSDLPEDWKF